MFIPTVAFWSRVEDHYETVLMVSLSLSQDLTYFFERQREGERENIYLQVHFPNGHSDPSEALSSCKWAILHVFPGALARSRT